MKEYQKLKKIIIKSNIKVTLIGVVIIVLGIVMIATPLMSEKGSASIMVSGPFGGVFALLGFLALRNSLPNIIKAKSDQHPLLKAITDKRKDFLVWVYKKEIQVTDANGGETYGTSNTLIYFDKDCKGKGVELAVSKKDSIEDIYNYLLENFDITYLGYSKDKANKINELFGNTGWRKVQ